MDRGLKNLGAHDRKSLGYLEETVVGNMEVKDASGKFSDGNEKHVIDHWRKGNPHYKMAERMAG